MLSYSTFSTLNFRAFIAIFLVTSHLCHAQETSDVSLPQSQESEALKQADQEEEQNLFRHRDFYIITGKPDTKVQLSFKVRLLKELDLYMGYTQLMFWATNKKSSPFTDTTYNPEIFYSYKLGEGFFRFVQVGVDHKSNGKAAAASRSIDRVFTQFDNVFGIDDNRFNWSVRFFALYDVDETNSDIRDYIGFWETKLSVESLFDEYIPLKSEFYVSFFPGKDPLMGGREFGIKLRVRVFGLLPYILMQSYHGHSESLLGYRQEIKAYRIGFLL